MYGQYGHKVLPATIGTDVSVSTAIDIGGGYNKIMFEIPTAAVGLITTTCVIKALVAQSSTDTFRQLKIQDNGSSAASGVADWQVPSGTGSYFVEVPVAGVNYIKIDCNNTGTAGLACKVHVIF